MSKHNDMPPAYSSSAPYNPPGIGFNTAPYPPATQGQWAPQAAPQFQQPQSTVTHTVLITPSMPIVPSLGNCPTCHIGNVHSEFTCCGICLAICCFPIGILCCLFMTNRRCSHCGALFG